MMRGDMQRVLVIGPPTMDEAGVVTDIAPLVALRAKDSVHLCVQQLRKDQHGALTGALERCRIITSEDKELFTTYFTALRRTMNPGPPGKHRLEWTTETPKKRHKAIMKLSPQSSLPLAPSPVRWE